PETVLGVFDDHQEVVPFRAVFIRIKTPLIIVSVAALVPGAGNGPHRSFEALPGIFCEGRAAEAELDTAGGAEKNGPGSSIFKFGAATYDGATDDLGCVGSERMTAYANAVAVDFEPGYSSFDLGQAVQNESDIQGAAAPVGERAGFEIREFLAHMGQ